MGTGAWSVTRSEPSSHSVDPQAAAQTFDRAVSLHRQGCVPAAEALYQAVLARDPDHPGALRQLGIVRLQQGDFEDALPLIRRGLDRDPDCCEARVNFGVALHALNRPAEALEHFERAIALEPERADAHYNLGRALQVLDRAADALRCYQRALALKPGYAEAHNNLGNVLLALNRPVEAVARFESALALRPDYADAHSNLGIAYHALDRYEEALASYARALALRGDHADAHNNLGLALRDMNRHAEAIACFERAQAVKPDMVDAQVNESLARLALGDFEAGWKKYQWRRLTTGFHRRKSPRPLWLGDWDLAGQIILLHGEQGLGDTLQFARYVPLVAQLGAQIILAVQRPLAPLLTGLAGVAIVRAQGDAVPPYDCYCPLPSLPLAFGTTVDTIPAEIPYIGVPADRAEKLRPVMEAIGRPRIGLMWAGNLAHPNHRRWIALRHLLPLTQMRDLHFVALQRELPEGDAPLLESAQVSTFLGERQADLADTAALIAGLDLVITVDTAIAHLAGALGKPVWVLLPFSADWRWLRHRDDSPWYPTARLFRQPALGDWAGAVAQVRNALAAERAGRLAS
jgi:tetratricopeptide (TPR) repeat protein